MDPEPETLGRLHRIFFPEAAPSPEWFDRLAVLLQHHGADVADLISYLNAMCLRKNGVANDDPSVQEAVAAPLAAPEHFGARVTVVIHVTKSEAWLGQVMDFYRDAGLVPVFTVDARTSEEARKVLSTRGAACIDIRDDHRGDASTSDEFRNIETPWLLRVDDDELPTPALLNFVDKAADYSTEFEWGFSRLHCRYDRSSGLQYSRFLPYGPFAGVGREWRLTARSSRQKERRAAIADAILLSFDWVVRPFAERVTRLQAGEVPADQLALSLASLHMHESIPESWHMFTSLPGKQYVEFAQKIDHSASREAQRSTRSTA
jgi:hypothetical protein